MPKSTDIFLVEEKGRCCYRRPLREDNRGYLKTLPAHIRLEYKLSGEKLNLVFAHGSTSSIDEYILIDTDADYVLEMLKEADADLLFVVHFHKPYHRIWKPHIESSNM